MPLEAAEVGLAGGGPLQVEQLGDRERIAGFPRRLNLVHFRGIEGLAQLFAGGEGVVFLLNRRVVALAWRFVLVAASGFRIRFRSLALFGLRFLRTRWRSARFCSLAASFGDGWHRCQVLTAIPASSRAGERGGDGERGFVAAGEFATAGS